MINEWGNCPICNSVLQPIRRQLFIGCKINKCFYVAGDKENQITKLIINIIDPNESKRFYQLIWTEYHKIDIMFHTEKSSDYLCAINNVILDINKINTFDKLKKYIVLL